MQIRICIDKSDGKSFQSENLHPSRGINCIIYAWDKSTIHKSPTLTVLLKALLLEIVLHDIDLPPRKLSRLPCGADGLYDPLGRL